jgi:dTDP-glucose 4,6-dehydratase
METMIVTGGAGFIGANFVRLALAQTEARVVVVDALTYAGHRHSLADVAREPRCIFVKADIADRATIAAVFHHYRPTWVVNCAAESHVDRSIDDPRPFLQTNVVGTFELLEAARAYLVQLDGAARARFRFLQVSTDEVFGTLGDTGWFRETTPYAPNSPYAASKAAADHFVRAYHETYGLPTLITHGANTYGPYQFPEKLIPLTLLNAIEGRPLPIYGDGGNRRDWLFVEDHCAGLLLVLQRGQVGETYTIGGHHERTTVEVVDGICAALEERLPAAANPALVAQGMRGYTSLKTFVEDRPGHDRRYAVDATKMRQALGWQPRYDVEAGLRRTVGWYLAHLDWCEAVQAGRYGRERLGRLAARRG